MPSKETPQKTEELTSFASILAETFIQRRALYARQLDDGSYISVKKPLKNDHLVAHLRGEITLGTYLLDRKSRGRFMVLDADSEPDWRRLWALAIVLAKQKVLSYLERSRRGGHLWVFFSHPLQGKQIREAGQQLMDHFGISTVELFPKQDRLAKGPGSLIRLPFGVHRKTGRRYSFYRPDGRPLAPTLREQIQALRSAETLSKPLFTLFEEYVSESQGKRGLEPSEGPRDAVLVVDEDIPLSDRIKQSIPVRQFVLRHVPLNEAGRGICPFHEDHVESFSVNDKENYWHCFACDKGGSIIDFWMMHRSCDFQQAVKELAAMLL